MTDCKSDVSTRSEFDVYFTCSYLYYTHLFTLILLLLIFISAFFIFTKPWGFSYEETIFSYIYAVLVSFLGLYILIVFCLRRKDVKASWKSFTFKRKRKIVELPKEINNISNQQNSNSIVGVVENSLNLSNAKAESYTSSFTNKSINEIGKNLNSHKNSTNLMKMSNFGSLPSQSASMIDNRNMVEMFYNPQQSNVAQKFFQRQKSKRQAHKHNNLQPLSSHKEHVSNTSLSVQNNTNYSQWSDSENLSSVSPSLFGPTAKVNNLNIHVEPNLREPLLSSSSSVKPHHPQEPIYYFDNYHNPKFPSKHSPHSPQVQRVNSCSPQALPPGSPQVFRQMMHSPVTKHSTYSPVRDMLLSERRSHSLPRRDDNVVYPSPPVPSDAGLDGTSCVSSMYMNASSVVDDSFSVDSVGSEFTGVSSGFKNSTHSMGRRQSSKKSILTEKELDRQKQRRRRRSKSRDSHTKRTSAAHSDNTDRSDISSLPGTSRSRRSGKSQRPRSRKKNRIKTSLERISPVPMGDENYGERLMAVLKDNAVMSKTAHAANGSSEENFSKQETCV